MELILKYIKEYKKEAIFAPLFKMLEAIFELFVPLVIARLIDIGIANSQKNVIAQCALLLFCLAIVGLVSSITAQYFAAKAAIGSATKLRLDLFKKIQRFSYTEIDEIGTDTMLTRLTSDLNLVQTGINMTLRLFLRSPFIVFGAMIMAFTINVKAALIFVITIPALAIVVYGIMVKSIPLYKIVQKKLDSLLSITRENFSGVRVIRAFGIEDKEEEEFESRNNGLHNLQIKVGSLSGLEGPITFVIVNAATVVLLYSGAVKVDQGILTRGEVVALVNYMSQILVELIKLANLIVTISKGLAGAERINEMMLCQLQNSEGDNELCKSTNHTNTANSEKDGVDKELCKLENNELCQLQTSANVELCQPIIVFDKVSLTYNGNSEPSLIDISFKANKGQTIGIIGGTGSGKSTLVNIIPELYDVTAGKVFYKGVPLEMVDTALVRREIAIVLQKAVLFKGSVADNLRFGRSDISDEKLLEALRIAQAYDFVMQKNGLATEVEQGGTNFSGGQRQRLHIARALVGNPEILILDDSSSALDFATDAALRKSISEYNPDCTVFIVSQRTSSIMNADEILVLDDGRVVGQGTHEELLSSCHIYKEIHNL